MHFCRLDLSTVLPLQHNWTLFGFNSMILRDLCQAESNNNTKQYNCNCNYILFTKLPWPGDSEGTFRSSSQVATCPPVYHTRRRPHTVPLFAERQAGKLWIPIFMVFGRGGVPRTSLASRTSSRTHFEVLGLGLEASSPWPWSLRSSKIALSSARGQHYFWTVEILSENARNLAKNLQIPFLLCAIEA